MSDLHRLCYKVADEHLAYKLHLDKLIYKWYRSSEGGDDGGDGSKRRITIEVEWAPVNWTCEAGDAHIMFGHIYCNVNYGQATLLSSDTSNVQQNTWKYEITEFPAQFTVTLGFSAACGRRRYPDVYATVTANCKTTDAYDVIVPVPQSGSASMAVAVAVDAAGNVSMSS